jgi:hypothetical protein
MSVVDVESLDEGFEALCASLQRNDSNVTSVGAIGAPLRVPPGQIRRFGEALNGTTSITALLLSVQSLQQSQDTSIGDNSNLIRFMRESRSLNHVILGFGNESTKVLCGRLLQGLHENSHIQRLFLELHSPVPSNDFSRFMQTTRSLTILRTTDVSLQDISQQVVGRAFQTNQSLELLEFSDFYGSNLTKMILTRLSCHPSLRTLRLVCMMQRETKFHVHGLRRLLCSTSSIKVLELEHHAFNYNHMKHLLGTLSAYKRLTKLFMTDFIIAENAGRLFEQYMRVYDPANSLRELHISITRIWSGPRSYSLFPAGSFLEVPRRQESSIGSSLHMLRLLNVNEDAFFGFSFSTFSEPHRLRSLRLDGVGDGTESWTHFERGIQRWTFLHELHIEEVDQEVVSPQVIQFLRGRKTIQCISVGKYSSAASFDRKGGPLKLVFGLTTLQQMLAEPHLDFRKESQINNGTNVRLFPTLFRVAKQAPVSGASSVLMGLRALKDTITGLEEHDAKRTGSSKSSAKRRQKK